MRIESTKGVSYRSVNVIRTQQQKYESPTVTLTWHASKFKVNKLQKGCPPMAYIIPSVSGTLVDAGVYSMRQNQFFYLRPNIVLSISKLAQHIKIHIHTFTC